MNLAGIVHVCNVWNTVHCQIEAEIFQIKTSNFGETELNADRKLNEIDVFGFSREIIHRLCNQWRLISDVPYDSPLMTPQTKTVIHIARVKG